MSISGQGKLEVDLGRQADVARERQCHATWADVSGNPLGSDALGLDRDRGNDGHARMLADAMGDHGAGIRHGGAKAKVGGSFQQGIDSQIAEAIRVAPVSYPV